MRTGRVHPEDMAAAAKRNRNGGGNLTFGLKRLRRLPHVFGNVLEMPLRSDADVAVEEMPDFYRFVARIGDLGIDGGVTARAVDIIPGMVKIVVVGNDDVADNDGVQLWTDNMELDAWRFRLPSSARPEMVTAEIVGRELMVTVPKDSGWEDGGDSWSSARLVMVQ